MSGLPVLTAGLDAVMYTLVLMEQAEEQSTQ